MSKPWTKDNFTNWAKSNVSQFNDADQGTYGVKYSEVLEQLERFDPQAAKLAAQVVSSNRALVEHLKNRLE